MIQEVYELKGVKRGLAGLVIVVSLAVTVVGCSSGQSATQNEANQAVQQQSSNQGQGSYLPVESARARQLIDNDTTMQIIDVREPDEFAAGHIEGAKLVPVGQLAARIGEIDRAKPVFVYCLSGVRSKQAAWVLAQNGYSKVYNLRHGLDKWPYPLVK